MWPSRRRAVTVDERKLRGQLQGLATALPALQEHLNMTPSGLAGLCLRPKRTRGKGDSTTLSLTELAEVASRALLWGRETSGASFKSAQDSYGYLWSVLRSLDFDGLVDGVSQLAAAVSEAGLGEHLVVAMFAFRREQQEVYWLFHFSRSRYYPFAPLEEPRRDAELELRMAGSVEKVLSVEPRLEQWHGLWGVPLSAP